MKMQYIYAHRGASGYAPENTLPAFEKAVDINQVLGVYIEDLYVPVRG